MKSKKIIAAGMALLLALSSAGCGKKQSPQGVYDNEILVTEPVDQDKTMITVRVENNIGQSLELEKVLEEKFPEVDFVLVHDGSINSLYTIRANMEAGVECDIILSRRLPVVSDIAEDYLLDLSTENYVDNYYLTALDSCTNEDGKLYFLPGPSDFYGIVYDKTLFEQYGWEVPHSYSEFVELLDTIEKETDLEALQPTLMYPDMFTMLFDTYGYDEAFAGVDNYRWLTEYQNGTGSMTDHMEAAVDKFKKLFEDGILSIKDLDVAPVERSNMLYVDHTAVMTIESQNAENYSRIFAEGAEPEGEYHEMGMMPFWTSDEEDSDYLYAIPSYYIAVNKSSAEESKSKKKLLLDIVEYFSSVEGQEEMLSGSMQISSVKGVSMEQTDFADEILDTIEDGRIINAFYFAAGEDNKQVERQMLGTLSEMLTGEMDVEEWLLLADNKRDEFLSGEGTEENVYGKSTVTLTKLETAYTLADMYKDLTGAQIGISLGGAYRNGTNGYFYEGDITDSSIECVNPNKEPATELEDPMDEKIVVAQMTGAQILDILNSSGISYDTKGQYPYYVASGLEVTFNPWGGEGNRVLSCNLSDGNELNPDETYEVAYFNGSLPDTSITPERALEGTWKENFLSWLSKNNGVIEKPEMTITLEYK